MLGVLVGGCKRRRNAPQAALFRLHNAAPHHHPQCRPSVGRLCRPYRARRKRHCPKSPPLSAPLQPSATRRDAPSPPSPPKGRPEPRMVGFLTICGIFSPRCQPPPRSAWVDMFHVKHCFAYGCICNYYICNLFTVYHPREYVPRHPLFGGG